MQGSNEFENNGMSETKRWLLPEGIEELLPDQAEHMERLRRQVLDLFHSWGYELIDTPLVEYIDSLLIGRGDDLDLQTYKIIDQLNGRLMGVRADITPQAARIDAHHLKRRAPTRLCYVGQVLHTRSAGLAASREPIQVGAELYGHAGIESDIEIIHLMIETLRATGIQDIHLDLGHVSIFRSLAHEAGLDQAQESALFDAMQRKAKPDMMALLREFAIGQQWRDLFGQLVDLNGGAEVLIEAAKLFKQRGAIVQDALVRLKVIAASVQQKLPNIPLHFDLAELRGYHYKTGIVFAAFVPGLGQELARGGRYDEIGGVYGRARPATGFSTDLKTLVRMSAVQPYQARAILAPHDGDPALCACIAQLRQQGERVITALPGQGGNPREQGCDRQLQRQQGQWVVQPLS